MCDTHVKNLPGREVGPAKPGGSLSVAITDEEKRGTCETHKYGPCSAALGAYRYSAHVGRSSQPTGTNYLRYESTKNLPLPPPVDKQQGGNDHYHRRRPSTEPTSR